MPNVAPLGLARALLHVYPDAADSLPPGRKHARDSKESADPVGALAQPDTQPPDNNEKTLLHTSKRPIDPAQAGFFSRYRMCCVWVAPGKRAQPQGSAKRPACALHWIAPGKSTRAQGGSLERNAHAVYSGVGKK